MIQKRKPSKDKKRQKKVGFKVRNDLNLPTFTRDKLCHHDYEYLRGNSKRITQLALCFLIHIPF